MSTTYDDLQKHLDDTEMYELRQGAYGGGYTHKEQRAIAFLCAEIDKLKEGSKA